MMAVIIIGFISLIAAFVRLPIGLVDVYVLILCGLTILFGSRITIPIPRFKSRVAVSDTFIFLVLL